MLKGRLGLESAKVPHKDRAGLLYLARGALTARDGTLAFLQGERTSADALDPGDYAIPLQGVSMIMIGPGSTVSHDALRLLAHARTALAAVGEDGVRFYTAPPLIPDRSGLAREQARLSLGRRRSAAERRAAHVRVAAGKGAAAPFSGRVARNRRGTDEGKLPPACSADWCGLARTTL